MRYYLEVGNIISASHNPLENNGIKFFGKDGQKLTDEQEKAIEDYMLDTDIENSLPVIRVMAEAKTMDMVNDIVNQLSSFIRECNNL